MVKLRRYAQGQIEADGGSARARKINDDAPATTASSPLHAKAKLLMAANDAILLYATDELQNHFQGLWQVTSKLHGILDAEDKKNLKLLNSAASLLHHGNSAWCDDVVHHAKQAIDSVVRGSCGLTARIDPAVSCNTSFGDEVLSGRKDRSPSAKVGFGNSVVGTADSTIDVSTIADASESSEDDPALKSFTSRLARFQSHSGGKGLALEPVPSHSGGKGWALEPVPSHSTHVESGGKGLAQELVPSHRGGKGLALEPVPSHSTHASNHAALCAAPGEASVSSRGPEVQQPNSAGSADAGRRFP